MRKFNTKIQPLQRLIFAALMVLTSLVLVASLSISYFFQKELLVNQTVETTEINALQAGESLQNMFFNMDNILRTVTVELQLYSQNDESIQALIDSSVELNTVLDSMSIIDPSGQITAYAPSYRRLMDDNEDALILDPVWYQADKQFDQALYSVPHLQTIFRQNPIDVISVTIPFIFQGESHLLLADFDISLLERYFKADFNTTYGDSYIVDQNFNVIYSPDQLSEGIEEIHEGIKSLNILNESFIDSDNDFVVATNRIGTTPWTVVQISYINVLIAGALNSIWWSSIVIFIVILIIVGYFSFIASNYISKPLTGIVDKMQALNRENITESYIDNIKLQASNMYAEANLLTQSYNQLVDTIVYLMARIQAEEEALRKSERNTLEAQIQPHFLYNTLESVLWMIEQKNNQEASEMVRSLGKMLRISLSKGYEKITVERELEQVEHYFIIQSLRYKNQFTYRLEIPDELRHYLVIKLVVQPLVENAIYHGVSRTVDPGLIEVIARQKNGQIFISVRDNGLGIDENKLVQIRNHLSHSNESFGLGLANVHQRLQIYYGKQYGVSIQSELDYGTEVTIHFPIEEKEVVK